MNTKERILEKGRKLFNSKGIRSVSLRDIAKSLDISYGNLTYHYSTKEILLTWIYIEMMEEHQEITKQIKNESNLLENLLLLPENTFDLSFKYLFLFQDFVEIERNYASIAQMQSQLMDSSKSDLISVFLTLKEQSLFRSDIQDQEIEYLIEISNYLRLFYFMKLVGKPLKGLYKLTSKAEYVMFINKLLYPYLTDKGLLIYKAFSVK